MAEVVRYRADEAIRWLDTGGDVLRKEAAASGRAAAAAASRDFSSVKSTIKHAAASAREYGRAVSTDFAHKRAEAVEYTLYDDHLDVTQGGTIRSIQYSDIASIEVKGDRGHIRLINGEVVIKPIAHLVTAGAKVPLGWSRNGLDAPFATLVEEIAARADVHILRN